MAEARPIPLSKYVALSSPHVVARAFWIFTFALLTAVGAQLEIPHQPVPFTLQTFFVILAGGLLGRRDGFLSMAAYLGLGAAGVPMFSGLSFGVARLLGPTGGYLLAFPIAAFFVGTVVSMQAKHEEKPGSLLPRWLVSYGWILAGMFLGLLSIFALGTLQLQAVYFHNWELSFQSGFLIFSWWDLLKLVSAAAICKELMRSV